jgi:hypothetical protein
MEMALELRLGFCTHVRVILYISQVFNKSVYKQTSSMLGILQIVVGKPCNFYKRVCFELSCFPFNTLWV